MVLCKLQIVVEALVFEFVIFNSKTCSFIIKILSFFNTQDLFNFFTFNRNDFAASRTLYMRIIYLNYIFDELLIPIGLLLHWLQVVAHMEWSASLRSDFLDSDAIRELDERQTFPLVNLEDR